VVWTFVVVLSVGQSVYSCSFSAARFVTECRRPELVSNLKKKNAAKHGELAIQQQFGVAQKAGWGRGACGATCECTVPHHAIQGYTYRTGGPNRRPPVTVYRSVSRGYRCLPSKFKFSNLTASHSVTLRFTDRFGPVTDRLGR
jgi:hypothetical protein